MIIFIILLFLLYASYLDITTRNIPNKVWVTLLLLTSPFTFSDFIHTGFPQVLITLSSLGVMVIILLPTWQLAKFGGADVKALLTISLIVPSFAGIGHFQPFHNNFALSVLCNALIFTIVCSPLLKNKNSIPFILPITGGFIYAATVGDILTLIQSFL